MQWVPEGACVMFPQHVVVEMFGHDSARSTSSMMSRAEYGTMVKGWLVDEVNEVLGKRDPKLVEQWRLRKNAQEEK